MGFRTNSTNLSEFGGLQLFDSDGVSEVDLTSTPQFEATCEFPLLSDDDSSLSGLFMGGREGQQKPSTDVERVSYLNETGSAASRGNRHLWNGMVRHTREEFYGHLDGKPIAVGCGIIAAAKRADFTGIPESHNTPGYIGVDLYRYDGSYIKTLDPRTVPGGEATYYSAGTTNDRREPENDFDWGTSVAIGEGRILITNPYNQPEIGSGQGRWSTGSAHLFDLDGNPIGRRYDDRGGYMNINWGNNSGYGNIRQYVQSDMTTRVDEPEGFNYQPAAYTYFGMASAIGEGRIVITAPADDYEGLTGSPQATDGRGVFHIFDLNLNHIKTVKNPDKNTEKVTSSNYHYQTNRSEGFGKSIAIGNGRIVVGAPNWQSDPAAGKGKIFVFDLDGNLLWSKQNPGSTDYYGCFGNSVAVGSGRVVIGNYMYQAPGTPNTDTNRRHPGRIDVYDLDGNSKFNTTGSNGTGSNYSNKNQTSRGEYLGYSVAISDNRIYATSKYSVLYQNTGKLRTFTLDGTLLETKQTDVSQNYFGESVAAGDGMVIVSAPGSDYSVPGGGSYKYAGSIYAYSVPKVKSNDTWRKYDQVRGGRPLNANIDFSTTRIYQEIKASTYIGEGGTLTIDDTDTQNISSNEYVYSDDTSVPALLVDVKDATIVNKGKIIGRGGDGGTKGVGSGNPNYGPGADGGPAIVIAATGVTITNNSGAYIAGGGGGGSGTDVNQTWYAGGGGGAGGGNGGEGSYANGGFGGLIVAIGGGDPGDDGGDAVRGTEGGHGGGGGGGGATFWDEGTTFGGGGGGGGRDLPGTGGAGGFLSASGSGSSNNVSGGNGGNAGVAGSSGTGDSRNSTATTTGGGGGWGADGGSGAYSGGKGGAAIKAVGGVSYTLTNNGTIYGST